MNDFPKSNQATLDLLTRTDTAYRNMNKFRFVRLPCYPRHETSASKSVKDNLHEYARPQAPYVDKKLDLKPIFPINAEYRTKQLLDEQLQPRHTDRWPIGFDKKEWDHIWAARPLHIDEYLLNVRIGHKSTNVTAIRERTYLGVSWRLRIDAIQAARRRMPILRQGMVLSYQKSHTSNYRYVIDHCVFHDSIEAYLRVYCFDKSQAICPNDSTRPSFLLIVPVEYSQVRDYPHEVPPKFKSPFQLSSSSLPYVSPLFPASKFSLEIETTKASPLTQSRKGTASRTSRLTRFITLLRGGIC